MKKKIIPIALLAVLSLAATSCQKETIEKPSVQIQQSISVRNITYTIDGATFHQSIRGEQNWLAFIDWMSSLAKEGHTVIFRNDNTYNASQSSKERVEYTTSDKDDANKWCNNMIAQGYEVQMYFDDTTGKYICIAIK
ncbi:MAG: hypothetical protein IJK99_01880 [Bacteroidales bacterium]|nr:hypothetical protein [Bacteroidales bacterium]